MKGMTNIRVNCTGGNYGDALMCDLDGFHYHVWLEPNTHALKSEFLYKTKISDDVQKDVRKCSMTSIASQKLVNAMMTAAIEEGMFEAAEARLAAEKETRELEHTEAVRVERIKKAGVMLYDALRGALFFVPVGTLAHENANKAIDAAEGR